MFKLKKKPQQTAVIPCMKTPNQPSSLSCSGWHPSCSSCGVWSPRCPRAWWGAWFPRPAAGWWRARWWWWWCRSAAASPWAPGPGAGSGRREWHHVTLRREQGSKGQSASSSPEHPPVILHPQRGMAIIQHCATTPKQEWALQTLLLKLWGCWASTQKSSHGARQSEVLQHKGAREHFSALQSSANVQLSFAQPMKNLFLLEQATQWKR